MHDFFKPTNILTTLKLVVVGLPVATMAWIARLVSERNETLGSVLLFVVAATSLFAYGYFANKLWSWR